MKVREGENFPCDLILVHSSLPKGISFVETKNLDGETNLKQKNAHEECSNLLTGQKESIFEILRTCSVNCEGPNEFLYRFSGNLLHRPSGEAIPIDEKAILLRGSSLRNTEWVIGIAVYTGHETKIMQNSKNSKVKQSKNAKALNYYIMLCMLIQLLCSVTGAIISTIQQDTILSGAWYL